MWKLFRAPSVDLVEEVSGDETLEPSRRGPVGRVARDPPLLGREPGLHRLRSRAETELAVEPEGARLDRFRVLVAELIRVDREGGHAIDLVEKPKDAAEDPGGLAFAERVIDVEADLDPLEEGEALDVADRDAVLHDESGETSPQRQATVPLESHQKDLDSAAGSRGAHRRRIGVREAVVLAIAERGRSPSQVDHPLSLGARHLAERQRRRGRRFIERDIAPRDQRLRVEEKLRRAPAHAGPRNRAVSEAPFDGNPERFVALDAISLRERKRRDPLEQPGEVSPAVGLGRAQPLGVRHVRVLQCFLLEERQESREKGAQPVGVVLVLPVEPDAARKARGEPGNDVERIVRGDRRSRDSRDLRPVEGLEVASRPGDSDARGEPRQVSLGVAERRAVVRIRAHKEQCFVEPDQGPGLRGRNVFGKPEQPPGFAVVGAFPRRGLEPGDQRLESFPHRPLSLRTSSIAERSGSISIGRLARGGGGSASW
jgi:hypothetical protein